MGDLGKNLLISGLPLIIATVLATGVLALARQLSAVTKSLKNLGRLEAGLQTLFVVNDKQNRVQQSTLEVTSAILDAIQTGHCNGNITSAKERNRIALETAKDARESAQEFLIDHAVSSKG